MPPATPPPDTTATHRIRVAREQFKFSCAHMTVFRDGSKERIHGHNFTVAFACDVASASLKDMVDFSSIKEALGALCEDWKERLLIGARNPHLVIVRDEPSELEFTLCGCRYVVPRDEVLLLPVDNATVEALAELAAHRLRERLATTLAGGGVQRLEVTVEESPGQGATCCLPLG